MKSEFLRRLVGVIDIQCGVAVRAVAGDRDNYLPFRNFLGLDEQTRAIDGDAERLAEQYVRNGLTSLYVADLDGIRHRTIQYDLVEKILKVASSAEQILLDLGIHGEEIESDRQRLQSLMTQYDNALLVVAAESLTDLAVLANGLGRISRSRLVVSFDYRDGSWVSESIEEDALIDRVNRLQIPAVIGLDIAAVGTHSIEPAMRLCQRLRAKMPNAEYLTGGGIRDEADIQRLHQAGADRCLVASLFESR